MPAIITRGAASAKGFGFAGKTGPAVYIEDVFSTYLYTGTGAAQTITNNIDLSTYGGLVWIKARSAATNNYLGDTVRGRSKSNKSDQTEAELTSPNAANDLSSFNSNGFSIGIPSWEFLNTSAVTYASWTFREQPKFFDIVTYTGDGLNARAISHNLGSTPGMIIIKKTTAIGDWPVYHTSLGIPKNLKLNGTDQAVTDGTGYQAVSSTTFTIGTNGDLNASGETFIAYLFAHNAGGFGLAGTDNVISCGTYTGNGSATGPVVTLGYEPQWLMIKKSSSTGNWQMIDNMRGMPVGSADATLQANLTNAESSVEYVSPTSTGFQITSTNTEVNTSAATYIYIAIRRGPMKVPTDATKVFVPVIGVSSSSAPYMTDLTSFTVDAQLMGSRTNVENKYESSRLQGTGKILYTNTTGAEVSADYPAWDRQTGVGSNVGNTNFSAYITYNFQRAPGFFDEVCYTGTGFFDTYSHNLGIAPELIITKPRSTTGDWGALTPGNPASYLKLNLTDAVTTLGNYPATSTTFTTYLANTASATYVNYLFATLAGVSKVGTYTGNGSSQTIACGFTAGSRFVMIKRTDSTGDWYVWDSARGIVAGNDPHLSLNTTAAEVTTDDSVDTDNSGFIVNQLAATNVNVTSATYIFLAVS
jgi:hypothetical protein